VAELLAGRRTVVEGYRTTQALHELCQQKGITAPILGEMYAILYQGKKPRDALMALMTRELKRETNSPFPRK
jgi:glycerol-3-phosphate dehydrogenase (NAD(P)+)